MYDVMLMYNIFLLWHMSITCCILYTTENVSTMAYSRITFTSCLEPRRQHLCTCHKTCATGAALNNSTGCDQEFYWIIANCISPLRSNLIEYASQNSPLFFQNIWQKDITAPLLPSLQPNSNTTLSVLWSYHSLAPLIAKSVEML